jgi:hypothetical protein
MVFRKKSKQGNIIGFQNHQFLRAVTRKITVSIRCDGVRCLTLVMFCLNNSDSVDILI